ncbi:radical SAM protein [Methanoculleus sp. DTU007]|uniref:radical SAM protein n=1 Tax=Methanoculleus sp. DTU007 TaxID=1671626 RepID=UPI000B03D4F4|nr:radical SAM protein [Methanoculleus sp. DTU007]NLN08257.1 radical SAM protein [Methanoculleus thermophilus]
MGYHHLFGPVLSRRLGTSLGVDLMPQKTCAYDCIYCECGRTLNLTCERREYVPADQVIAELDDFLATAPDLDYVTFAGSGELTLHTGIERIIAFIKDNYPHYQVAVLTGSMLLPDPEVRAALMRADLVVPSLDAVSKEVFEEINRPCPGITAERVLAGITAFAREFTGQIWLEVFIVPGLNDTPEELRLLKDAVAAINPDRVQINTLDRPGTEIWVRPANPGKLEQIASMLGGEVIDAASPGRASSRDAIDTGEGLVEPVREGKGTFYRAA